MCGSVGAAGGVVYPSAKVVWAVGGVLAAVRRRNTPVDTYIIHTMVAAPNAEIDDLLRLLHTYKMVDVAWYTSNVVTLTEAPARPLGDTNAMIMQMLHNSDVALTEHGIAVHVRMDLHRIHRHVVELEKMGLVTLRSKSYEFVMLRSRLNVLRAAGKAALGGLFRHGS